MMRGGECLTGKTFLLGSQTQALAASAAFGRCPLLLVNTASESSCQGPGRVFFSPGTCRASQKTWRAGLGDVLHQAD